MVQTKKNPFAAYNHNDRERLQASAVPPAAKVVARLKLQPELTQDTRLRTQDAGPAQGTGPRESGTVVQNKVQPSETAHQEHTYPAATSPQADGEVRALKNEVSILRRALESVSRTTVDDETKRRELTLRILGLENAISSLRATRATPPPVPKDARLSSEDPLNPAVTETTLTRAIDGVRRAVTDECNAAIARLRLDLETTKLQSGTGEDAPASNAYVKACIDGLTTTFNVVLSQLQGAIRDGMGNALNALTDRVDQAESRIASAAEFQTEIGRATLAADGLITDIDSRLASLEAQLRLFDKQAVWEKLAKVAFGVDKKLKRDFDLIFGHVKNINSEVIILKLCEEALANPQMLALTGDTEETMKLAIVVLAANGGLDNYLRKCTEKAALQRVADVIGKFMNTHETELKANRLFGALSSTESELLTRLGTQNTNGARA